MRQSLFALVMMLTPATLPGQTKLSGDWQATVHFVQIDAVHDPSPSTNRRERRSHPCLGSLQCGIGVLINCVHSCRQSRHRNE